MRAGQIVAVILASLLCGCASEPSPEDAVRKLVAHAEAAAETRDARALTRMIADDYRDARGNGAEDLRRLLHGYLIAHQSVHLLVRIEEIELLGNDLARVRATVGMLGREAGSGSGWDVATDLRELDLRLAREASEWRVIRAQW